MKQAEIELKRAEEELIAAVDEEANEWRKKKLEEVTQKLDDIADPLELSMESRGELADAINILTDSGSDATKLTEKQMEMEDKARDLVSQPSCAYELSPIPSCTRSPKCPPIAATVLRPCRR